jgi:hypothetical protein
MSPDPQFPTALVAILVIAIVLLLAVRRRNVGKTNTNLGWYHPAMELNLLLWGAMLYHSFPKIAATKVATLADYSDPFLAVASVGFLLSLILQHCAYYDFRKPRNPKDVLSSAPPNSRGSRP